MAKLVIEVPEELARVPQLRRFARKHKLLMITIADLIKYRMRNERLVRRVAESKLPTEFGEFELVAFESIVNGETHVALVQGDLGDGNDVLVRVHSRCLTGEVFHSRSQVRLRTPADGGDGADRR